MREELKIDLVQGKYQNIERVYENIDDDIIKNILLEAAYEMESLCVYSFVQYMVNKTKKISWLELAIDILLGPLCFMEGAYSVALFHSRELLLVNRSVENLERLLFFYDIPEKLVPIEEAKMIAEEILMKEPNNKVALSVI